MRPPSPPGRVPCKTHAVNPFVRNSATERCLCLSLETTSWAGPLEVKFHGLRVPSSGNHSRHSHSPCHVVRSEDTTSGCVLQIKTKEGGQTFVMTVLATSCIHKMHLPWLEKKNTHQNIYIIPLLQDCTPDPIVLLAFCRCACTWINWITNQLRRVS